MPLDPLLIEVLACPRTRAPSSGSRTRTCSTTRVCSRAYQVRDAIPVMLIDESVAVDDAEHDRLVAKAEAGGVPRRPGTARADDVGRVTTP